MVRKVIHKNLIFGSITLATVVMGSLLASPATYATCTNVNGTQGVDCDMNFSVNVGEFISISLTTPENWAQGNINTLLRNKVTVDVSSNYPGGFQASMASKTNTNLVNQAKSSSVINTLDSATTASAFPSNRWGYSLDDSDTGLDAANYNAMDTAAISLITKAQSTSTKSKNVYFGAKAGMDKDSGTYANTVVFTVVSGVIDSSETQGTPVTPRDTSTSNPSYAYDSSADQTVYTAASTTGTGTSPISGSRDTTTTQISKGDVTAAYAAPLGVTTSSINEGTPLATGLAISAGIAAVTGVGFFIAAKRSDKDDGENKN